MKKIFNSKCLAEQRKRLRNNMPEPEKRIWLILKARQFFGYKFRRQESIGSYIVDFYCKELNLVIEIDGDSHFDDSAIIYDKNRDYFLGSLGLCVLRFTNNEVMENIDGVLGAIENEIISKPPPAPPSKGGEI